MKKKFWIILTIMLFICGIAMFFILQKDYYISTANSYIPYVGAADIYNASREELLALDMIQYSHVFGKVETEKQAFQIAAKVIKEVYGKAEAPYIVKFNNNANAWIVSGTSSFLHMGGVASIAIDKETGQILMLIHTK